MDTGDITRRVNIELNVERHKADAFKALSDDAKATYNRLTDYAQKYAREQQQMFQKAAHGFRDLSRGALAVAAAFGGEEFTRAAAKFIGTFEVLRGGIAVIQGLAGAMRAYEVSTKAAAAANTLLAGSSAVGGAGLRTAGSGGAGYLAGRAGISTPLLAATAIAAAGTVAHDQWAPSWSGGGQNRIGQLWNHEYWNQDETNRRRGMTGPANYLRGTQAAEEGFALERSFDVRGMREQAAQLRDRAAYTGGDEIGRQQAANAAARVRGLREEADLKAKMAEIDARRDLTSEEVGRRDVDRKNAAAELLTTMGRVNQLEIQRVDLLGQQSKQVADQLKAQQDIVRSEKARLGGLQSQFGLMDEDTRQRLVGVGGKLARGETLSRDDIDFARSQQLLAPALEKYGEKLGNLDPRFQELVKALQQNSALIAAQARSKALNEIKVELTNEITAAINIDAGNLARELEAVLAPRIQEAMRIASESSVREVERITRLRDAALGAAGR